MSQHVFCESVRKAHHNSLPSRYAEGCVPHAKAFIIFIDKITEKLKKKKKTTASGCPRYVWHIRSIYNNCLVSLYLSASTLA